MSDRSQRPPWLGEDNRGWDHVRVHVQVYKDQRLGAYEIAIYGGIAVHAELATGQAYPSRETLASYAKCSERQVYDSIKILEEAGYISVKKRPGKSSVLTLLRLPSLEDTPAPHAGVLEGHPGTWCRTPRHQVPDTPAPGADEQEPVTRTSNERNPLPLPSLTLVSGGRGEEQARAQFETFWLAYPRHRGSNKPGGGGVKREAWERWCKMSPQDRLAALVAVEHYASYMANSDEKPPYAERWLKQERWTIWLTPAEGQQRPQRRQGFDYGEDGGDTGTWF